MGAPEPIHVVGGGLAGSEASWQIAQAGIPVVLHEMQPCVAPTPTKRRPGRARLFQFLPLRRRRDECGRAPPSGDAPPRLAHHARGRPASGSGRRRAAVDQDGFSAAVTAALEAHPLVTIARGEVAGLPPEEWSSSIVATGPLTSPALAAAVLRLRVRRNSHSSMPSRRSSTGTPSIWRWPGSSRAMTRPGRAPGPTTSIAPLDRDRYEAFVTPSSRATRRTSRNGRGRRISTGACRSRS